MDIKREIRERCFKIHCDCNDYKDCDGEREIYRLAIRKILMDCNIEKYNIDVRFHHNAYGKGQYRIAVAWISYYDELQLLVIW